MSQAEHDHNEIIVRKREFGTNFRYIKKKYYSKSVRC